MSVYVERAYPDYARWEVIGPNDDGWILARELSLGIRRAFPPDALVAPPQFWICPRGDRWEVHAPSGAHWTTCDTRAEAEAEARRLTLADWERAR